MIICDLHCDLPYKVLKGTDIHSNKEHFSEEKLKKENTYVQVFANFVDAKEHPDSFDYINSMIIKFKEELLTNTNIGLVTDYTTLKENIKNNKNSAILSIEGGEALGGDIKNVEYFYNLGIRFLTLTWNYKNDLGEGAVSGNSNLTEFGREVLKEMNRVKMVADVSHLCEKGFWNAAEITGDFPFVATHSNSQKLCGHKRNLTDEQFLQIVKKGGLVGINYYPLFLENNPDNASVTSIIRHIEHFLSLGGEDVISLGSDFDGIDYLPEGINSISGVDVIAQELRKLNYKDELIEKIMGQNTVEFIKRI